MSSSWSSRPGDSTALQAVFSAESDVVRNERFETENLLNAETVKSRADDVRRETEVWY